MRFSFRSVAATVLLCSCSVLAQADEAATKRLNALLGKITSMQSAFVQNTLDPQGKPLQTLNGHMQVKRPGNFRWSTEQPFEQLIIANGQTVWIFDPELQQATRQAMDKQVGNTPALLLSGDVLRMASSFTISEEKATNKNVQVFVLRPKDKDALFESLRVSFFGKQLISMELKDSLGQQTDITFSQVVVNGKIADSLFQFVPPKGVDVINEL